MLTAMFTYFALSNVSSLVTWSRKRIPAVGYLFTTQVLKDEQLEDFGHNIKAKMQQNVVIVFSTALDLLSLVTV